MDLRGPSLGLVGPSIESERTLPRSYRPALDLIGLSLGLSRPERAHSRPERILPMSERAFLWSNRYLSRSERTYRRSVWALPRSEVGQKGTFDRMPEKTLSRSERVLHRSEMARSLGLRGIL